MVDFNSRDEDGAVWLTWDNEMTAEDGNLIPMREGLEVSVTDTELRAAGYLAKRDGLWVVIISEIIPAGPLGSGDEKN
jgi:hypothetical protein